MASSVKSVHIIDQICRSSLQMYMRRMFLLAIMSNHYYCLLAVEELKFTFDTRFLLFLIFPADIKRPIRLICDSSSLSVTL